MANHWHDRKLGREYIHWIEVIFVDIILGLSITTLCSFSEWKEVRFTVAAAAWAVLSLIVIQQLCRAERPALSVLWIFEFLNWAMFFAVWIALAEQISCNTSFCSLPSGGHSTVTACKTIYAALAFAVAVWVMFTVSLGHATWLLFTKKPESKAATEGRNSADNV